MRFIEIRGETVGFAASKAIVYWVLRGQQGSIPFTRSTSPPFSLNGLPLRRSFQASDSHNRLNGLHLRSDVLTLCSDLCASVSIDGFAVAASV